MWQPPGTDKEKGSLHATGVLNRLCPFSGVRKGEELTYFFGEAAICSLRTEILSATSRKEISPVITKRFLFVGKVT